jgi:16S rRNA pseudouridine516 synthase
MSKQALERILQSQGFGTRKWCRELVLNGDVNIVGAIITDPQTNFETNNLEFSVFDEVHQYREHLYIALHKPVDYECSRKPSHHPGVLSLLPEQFTRRDVQPVGRLDHDTTGLLLMSDDGTFIHAQSSPKRHIPKIYVATTQEAVTQQLVDKLLNGVKLHDEPAQLKAVSCNMITEKQIEIVLEQGKYHQVKRMLAAAGNHCTALRRSQIGALKLDDLALAAGDWCYLQTEQLALLKPAQ